PDSAGGRRSVQHGVACRSGRKLSNAIDSSQKIKVGQIATLQLEPGIATDRSMGDHRCLLYRARRHAVSPEGGVALARRWIQLCLSAFRRGAAGWRHSISPMTALIYSIIFRVLY